MRVRIFLTTHRYQIVTITALVLLCGLGGWLRFHQIGKLSLWLDEAFTYNQSKGGLRSALRSDANMSLFWVMAHYWVRIFPHASETVLRIPSAIFSLAGIPAIFLLGQTLLADKKKATAVGLIAALMVTINAYQIQYAQEFRSYSLFFLTFTMSTFLLIKTVERSDGTFLWPVGYTLATVAVFYSHFYAVLFIAAQAMSLLALLADKKKRARIFKRLLFSAIGIGVLILPMMVIAVKDGPQQISWILKPTWLDVQTFFKNISGFTQDLSLAFLDLALVCIGAVYVLRASPGQNLYARWKVVLLVGCLFIPVIASLTISVLLKPIFHPRYLFPVITFVVVLAAAGIVGLGSLGVKKRLVRALAVAAGLAALGWYAYLSGMGLQHYYTFEVKEDWRAASQFLTAHCSDSLRLYYEPYVDSGPKYYNPALKSQVTSWWYKTLNADAGAEEIAAGLPEEYDQVCLTLMSNNQQRIIVLDAIQMKYPVLSETFEFKGVEVRIFKRR